MQKNARRRQISMSAQHRCLSPTAPADSAPRDAVVADRNRGRSILQTEDCRTSLQTEIFPENRGQISHFLTPVKLGKWLAKCFRVILWRHLGPNHWDAFDGGEGGGAAASSPSYDREWLKIQRINMTSERLTSALGRP